nr:atp synthase subunit beta, mitochondrial [Quercus suber]
MPHSQSDPTASHPGHLTLDPHLANPARHPTSPAAATPPRRTNLGRGPAHSRRPGAYSYGYLLLRVADYSTSAAVAAAPAQAPPALKKKGKITDKFIGVGSIRQVCQGTQQWRFWVWRVMGL